MFIYAIAFLLGDICLQLFSTLPHTSYAMLAVVICVFLYVVYERYRRYIITFIAFLMGFLWAVWYASSILAFSLPQEIEGKSVIVRGIIASIPEKDEWQTNFMFDLKSLQAEHVKIAQPTRIRLSWRGDVPQLIIGDEWQLHVRLKKIHSTQNPGAYDYEQWAFQHGIRAQGYILADSENKIISSNALLYAIGRWRQAVDTQLQHALPDDASPWLYALIVGERHHIASNDWDVLRATGTNHLMAIAGLHIGMLAGFVHFIFSFCWRRSERLTLLCPASVSSTIAAFIAALFYSLLAGFSLPAQRALMMLGAFALLLIYRRQAYAWHVWSLALVAVLLINPLTTLSESFWLSFGTIALIIYGMGGRLAPSGWWWRWGRAQWVIGIGLIPFSLLFFQEVSFISFVANTIAIPWLGFFILPFCFLSALCLLLWPSIATLFLWLANKSLTGLWYFLTLLSQLPHATWHHAIVTPWILATTFIAVILLLLPSGVRGRLLSIIWLLPLIFIKPPTPAIGSLWLTMLDVGQGLALVIQTKSHVLVYDTGASFPGGMNMGDAVLLPYLRLSGIDHVDKLVLSHGDNDHIGGAKRLLESMSVLSIATSSPDKIKPYHAENCIADETWVWDQVQFQFLHPRVTIPYLGNDSSCVLQINNGDQTILLTGDIEKGAEKSLLANDSELLESTIITAPHHGSRTSGLSSFIKTVRPRYVLYSTGYRNRYHFPHPSVMRRYNDINAIGLNTAVTGAIQFKIEKNNPALVPDLFRELNKPFWH